MKFYPKRIALLACVMANGKFFLSRGERVVFNLKLKKMAKDSSGKKFNRIPAHTKVVDGKTINVKEHIRSNRKDSKG